MNDTTNYPNPKFSLWQRVQATQLIYYVSSPDEKGLLTVRLIPPGNTGQVVTLRANTETRRVRYEIAWDSADPDFWPRETAEGLLLPVEEGIIRANALKMSIPNEQMNRDCAQIRQYRRGDFWPFYRELGDFEQEIGRHVIISLADGQYAASWDNEAVDILSRWRAALKGIGWGETP